MAAEVRGLRVARGAERQNHPLTMAYRPYFMYMVFFRGGSIPGTRPSPANQGSIPLNLGPQSCGLITPEMGPLATTTWNRTGQSPSPDLQHARRSTLGFTEWSGGNLPSRADNTTYQTRTRSSRGSGRAVASKSNRDPPSSLASLIHRRQLVLVVFTWPTQAGEGSGIA